MKIIQKYGMLGIDKTEIDAFIAKKKFIGLNHSPRTEKVIVSLTSYKPRINDVKYVAYSLLNQTFPPDKLILWLDEDSFPQREKDLPRDLLKLRQFGLTIDWCENLRPYKKLIPALEKYPDDIIVAADDDIFYRPDWLKILYDEHLKYPDCLIAHYAHKIRLTTAGKYFLYNQWFLNLNPKISLPPLLAYSFGSGAGILLKKSFLYTDALQRETFTKLAPIADELWFWVMSALNGTKIKIPANPISLGDFVYVNIEEQKNGDSLMKKNYLQGQNDVQFQQILKKYPELLDILIREDAERKPYISVIMPVKNSAAVSDCLKNIFLQTFPEFELILINCGARVEMPTLPTNFHVINYPGGSFADAFNLGLRKATGEYILFKDES